MLAAGVSSRMERDGEPSHMLGADELPTPGVALPGWDTFALVIGGAAGALIGLLFVSVSIRIDVISASPDSGTGALRR